MNVFLLFTRIIVNVFFIFNMSIEFERIFSNVKHTINDEIFLLKFESIEILKYCKT